MIEFTFLGYLFKLVVQFKPVCKNHLSTQKWRIKLLHVCAQKVKYQHLTLCLNRDSFSLKVNPSYLTPKWDKAVYCWSFSSVKYGGKIFAQWSVKGEVCGFCTHL